MAGLPDLPMFASLTPREREICAALILGDCNKQIANRLQISTQTVSNHFRPIYRKIQVQDVRMFFAKLLRELQVSKRPPWCANCPLGVDPGASWRII